MTSRALRPSSQSLWDEAYSLLDNDLRISLGKIRDSKVDVVKQVLDTARNKRNACLTDPWKFREPGGGEVVVRDVLKKIIRWVDCFKAVGDMAVQYDPVHAALPWSAVRFLLQASVNSVEIFEVLGESLESISRLISQHALSEAVYLRSKTAATEDLRDTLTRLYAGILSYLAKVIQHFGNRRYKRIVKSLFKLPKTVGISNITSLDAEVDRSFSNQRLKESATWIMEHNTVVEWRESDSSSILLLHGVPGSGKSILASKVIDSLYAELPLEKDQRLAHFYCRRSPFESELHCPRNILASVLRQVAIRPGTQNQYFQEVLYQEFNWRRQKAGIDGFPVATLQVDESARLVKEATAMGGAFIILDALDEIEEEKRLELVDSLISLVESVQNGVKILITSREDPQILSLLPHAKQLKVCPEDTKNDMRIFIRHKIDKKKREQTGVLSSKPSTGFEHELCQYLQQRAGEMFLWAELQIERLSLIVTESDALVAVQSLPPDLNTTYKEILARVSKSGPNSQSIAISTFRWLLFAKETLKADTLLYAIASEGIADSDKLDWPSLVRICRNLIIMDEDSKRVRFTHTTVEEFLISYPDFASVISHQHVASRCLQVCAAGITDDLHTPTPQVALYRYSALYWPLHYRNGSLGGVNPVKKQMKKFVFAKRREPSLTFQLWMDDVRSLGKSLHRDNRLRRYYNNEVQSNSSTPLFTACLFGLDELLRKIDVPRFARDQPKHAGQTGLYLASSEGHASIVSYLIDKGSDVSSKCGNYGNPLHVACYRGHAAIAASLVEHGACPRRCDKKFDNALDAAIKGSHEAVAKILTEKQSPTLDQREIDMVLQGAGRAGFVEVVRLLQTLSKTQEQLWMEQTQDLIASGKARELRIWLSIHSRPLPPDALATAALHGHWPIIQLCLQQGLNIEARGLYGTPLRAASLEGHVNIVNTLLSIGADATDGEALEAASMKGHLPIVQALVEAGKVTSVISRSSFDCALRTASRYGHLGVLEYLVEVGGNDRGRQMFRSIQEAASDAGHEHVIRFVQEQDFLPRDDEYGPPTEPFYGA